MLQTHESVVKIENLRKVFRVGFWGRRVTAVEGLSLDVWRGEVFGFLDPNGAGKTTTLKMLMGLIYPTSGAASIFGYPIGAPAAKSKIGFLPESPYFYDYLTGGEFLRFYGSFVRALGGGAGETGRCLVGHDRHDSCEGSPAQKILKGHVAAGGDRTGVDQ